MKYVNSDVWVGRGGSVLIVNIKKLKKFIVQWFLVFDCILFCSPVYLL